MEVLQWIKGEHKGIRFFFENSVASALTHEQWRERPGGVGNSIVWLLWHMARTEDVMINTVVRGEPQILLSGDWVERIGIDHTHIGTGLSDEVVGEVSQKMDVAATEQYWDAVRAQTYEWLRSIEPADLDVVPDIKARIADAPPILAMDSGVFNFWEGSPVSRLLGATVINHGFIHLGEMQAIRGRLGAKAWF